MHTVHDVAHMCVKPVLVAMLLTDEISTFFCHNICYKDRAVKRFSTLSLLV